MLALVRSTYPVLDKVDRVTGYLAGIWLAVSSNYVTLLTRLAPCLCKTKNRSSRITTVMINLPKTAIISQAGVPKNRETLIIDVQSPQHRGEEQVSWQRSELPTVLENHKKGSSRVQFRPSYSVPREAFQKQYISLPFSLLIKSQESRVSALIYFNSALTVLRLNIPHDSPPQLRDTAQLRGQFLKNSDDGHIPHDFSQHP